MLLISSGSTLFVDSIVNRFWTELWVSDDPDSSCELNGKPEGGLISSEFK
jgi:hypothetical protein